MTRRVPFPAFGFLAACATLAALALATAAPAAVVTYTSTDVPKQIDDGQMTTSVIEVPQNLPPPIDLDLVGVRVSASGADQTGKYLFLDAPGDTFVDLLTGGCTMLNFNITFDDEAGPTFSAPADCTATATRRPTTPLSSALFSSGEEANRASGTWTLMFGDPGAPGGNPATLSAWAMRITFEPMRLFTAAKKQDLRKKLEIKARCSADCDLNTRGDAKNKTFKLNKGNTETLKVPLKGNARDRLEGGGKAKIKVAASNEIGDLIERKLKFKIVD